MPGVARGAEDKGVDMVEGKRANSWRPSGCAPSGRWAGTRQGSTWLQSTLFPLIEREIYLPDEKGGRGWP